jgi:hypothetical protein
MVPSTEEAAHIEIAEAPIDGRRLILPYRDYFETKTFNTKKWTRNRSSRTG